MTWQLWKDIYSVGRRLPKHSLYSRPISYVSPPRRFFSSLYNDIIWLQVHNIIMMAKTWSLHYRYMPPWMSYKFRAQIAPFLSIRVLFRLFRNNIYTFFLFPFGVLSSTKVFLATLYLREDTSVSKHAS